MQLIINKKLISAPIPEILELIVKETNYPFFRDVKAKGDNFQITCPFHKEGRESHPSCQIYAKQDDPELEYGFVHCFTCGKSVPLYHMVGHCFGEDDDFGKEWLVERFGDVFVSYEQQLTDIVLDKPQETFLDESILDNFMYYHEYMWKRKLSKEVVDKFKIGFNPATQSIVFPIWDDKGRLKMITERSVNTKYFYIQEDIDKPVYLLNFLIKEKQTVAYVCESQINALTLQSWGYPAVALIGTGSKKQLDILNRSGIREYYLCFDGDEPGDKGRQRFINNIRKDVFVNTVHIPRGKDINDLTKEEFENLRIS